MGGCHTARGAARLGRGLYISEQIVSLHGGRIAAESPPDGGTRVVVTLPAEAGLTERAGPNGVAEPAPGVPLALEPT
jgi:K+-sensing histidine kinase KdpD